ncbi:MAG: ABC transporter ATP-binding protein [Spirochaetales bacterium]|nr:ABC transporter ATP-binding protein [Spirochaetales bacterium]
MIRFTDCSFDFGPLTIMDHFSLEIQEKGTTVLLGPSGCGKTTLLNMAASLLAPAEGLMERSTDDLSYLFQKPRLLPWKTVEENIAFALDEKMDRDEMRERCGDLIRHVGLEGFEQYRPSRLSGGMEQRTAIARAFVSESPLLLMDEPFKGLDLKLKMPLIGMLNELLHSRRTAAVLVTHDVREAILMGDRIVFLDGPPLRLMDDMEGIPRQERDTASRAFYELEKKLYNLILHS